MPHKERKKLKSGLKSGDFRKPRFRFSPTPRNERGPWRGKRRELDLTEEAESLGGRATSRRGRKQPPPEERPSSPALFLSSQGPPRSVAA
jgi:hypothetical protein